MWEIALNSGLNSKSSWPPSSAACRQSVEVQKPQETHFQEVNTKTADSFKEKKKKFGTCFTALYSSRRKDTEWLHAACVKSLIASRHYVVFVSSDSLLMAEMSVKLFCVVSVGGVLLQMIQQLCSKHWCAVPLLFLSQALAKLPPSPLLGVDGLVALRYLIVLTVALTFP